MPSVLVNTFCKVFFANHKTGAASTLGAKTPQISSSNPGEREKAGQEINGNTTCFFEGKKPEKADLPGVSAEEIKSACRTWR